MCTRSGILPNPHIPGEPISMSFPSIEEIDFVTVNNIHTLHQFAQKPQVDEEHMNIMLNSFTKNEWDDVLAEFEATTDAAPYKPLLQTVNPAWLVNSSQLGLSPGSGTPPLDENIFSDSPSSNASNSSVTPDMAENTAVIDSLPGPVGVVDGPVVMFNVPPTPIVDLKPNSPPQSGLGQMPAQSFNMQQAYSQLYCPQPYYLQPIYSQQIYPPYGPDLNAQSNMAIAPMYPMSFNYNMPPYGYVPSPYQHPYQMMPSMGPPINQQQSFAAPASVTPSSPPKPSPEPVSNKRVFSFINETVPKNFVANPNNHGRWKIDQEGNRQYLNAPAAKRPRAKL
ncbi:hypothetical protein N7486_010809 [Penicillium sp. IBT 16267x]|nr:hypothetical protein N7486_010809 [Penicillium sp. IBT 16267x]